MLEKLYINYSNSCLLLVMVWEIFLSFLMHVILQDHIILKLYYSYKLGMSP